MACDAPDRSGHRGRTSQGGRPSDPQWYRNLMAHPNTPVQIRGEVRRVRSRTATLEERAALWPRLVELYPDFDNYQQWHPRRRAGGIGRLRVRRRQWRSSAPQLGESVRG